MCLGLAVVIVGTGTSSVSGQIFFGRMGGGGGARPGEPTFQVQIDESLQLAFADFERHVERQSWEKAFQSIMELPAEKQTGMLPGDDDSLITARQRIWQALVDLPPEGREAFRIFYDARADKLYSELTDPSDPATIPKLADVEQLFDRYFLTKIGDSAADLLGEMYFERGRFDDANRCWTAILDHHPNTELSEVRLHVKRALALAAAKRQDDFEAARRQIVQQFPDATVTLGGQEFAIEAALQDVQFVSTAETTTDGDPAVAPPGAPAEDVEPVWQVEFLSEQGRNRLTNSSRNNWYRNGVETCVPATASDGKAVYCNWFGLCFAADLETGKLLWRSEKFNQMSGRLQNMQQRGISFSSFSIVVGDGAVLAVSVPPDQLQQWQPQSRMTCYDAKTGAVKWTTQNVSGLGDVSFAGRPLIVGDEILATSYKSRQTELTVRRLSLQTGEELWSQSLGTAQPIRNRYGYQLAPTPGMTRHDEQVLILTNSGALVDFDLNSRSVTRIFRFGKAPPAQPQDWYWYYQPPDESTILHTRAAMLEHQGLTYFKEAADTQLYAVDPATQAVVWKRPIKKSAQLVGVDDNNCYLLSRELECIDRRTQKLRWSITLPIAGGGLSVVPTENGLLVNTARGLFEISGENGNVLNIFRGIDMASSGGAIRMVGDRVLCVSNRALTMYPLAKEDAEQAAATGE